MEAIPLKRRGNSATAERSWEAASIHRRAVEVSPALDQLDDV